MNENIEVLEEVLDVLEEEKRKFYDQVSQNEFRIEEINSYLKELSKREDEDFKVFSPRNAENMHREQIAEDTSEMKKYQDENAQYREKIEALDVLIGKVNSVIGNLQFFNDGEKEIGESDNYEQSVKIIDIERADIEGTDAERKDIERTDIERVEDSGEHAVEDDGKDDSGERDNDEEDQVKNSAERNVKTEDADIEDDLSEIKYENDLEKRHIAHQILNCVSFITPDAERAKIELTALSKKLME